MDGSFKSLIASVIILLLFGVSFIINSDLEYQKLCQGNENCIFKLVVEENSSDLCSISEYPESCYERAAFKFLDSTLCDFTLNVSSCYMDLAVELGDPILCAKTLNVSNYCLFQVATYTQNASICDFSDDIGLCYYSYAIHFNDVNYCNFSEKYKSTCDLKILGSFTNESN